jgi:muconolactone delta-isomerase
VSDFGQPTGPETTFAPGTVLLFWRTSGEMANYSAFACQPYASVEEAWEQAVHEPNMYVAITEAPPTRDPAVALDPNDLTVIADKPAIDAEYARRNPPPE